MLATKPSTKPFDAYELGNPSFWKRSREERQVAFAELRRERPLSWHRRPAQDFVESDSEGFWALVRHADVAALSRKPGTFSVYPTVTLLDMPEIWRQTYRSFARWDPPRHTTLRGLVTQAFKPHTLALIEAAVRNRARELIADLVARNEGDFVELVSSQLPLWTVCELLGVPERDRELVFELSRAIPRGVDPDAEGDPRERRAALVQAIEDTAAMCLELAEHRRREPADDLMTGLVNAELDGYRLSNNDIQATFLLLCLAGNTNLRSTISHGAKALSDFPDQRDRKSVV